MRRNLLASMMCATLTGALLSGCLETNTAYNPNASKEKFEANWEKAFGEIDPQQDWNTATRATAIVSVGYMGDYTAKIYTSDPRNATPQAYLLGKVDVKGNQTANLQLNIPETLTEVYVALVDKDMKRIVKPATVSDGRINVQFGGAETRTIYSSSQSSPEITVEPSGTYIYFGTDLIEQFTKIVPEDDEDNGIKRNNESNINPNFLYKSNGDIIVYPLYHVSNNSDNLGIYYYDGDNIKEIKIWDKTNYLDVAYYGWTADNGYAEETIYYQAGEDWTTKMIKWREDSHINAKTEKLRCPGIKISMPKGTVFGFWSTANYGADKIYTESSLNPGTTYTTYGATFNDNEGNLYVAFEDWIDHDSRDFNDLVCLFESDGENAVPPTIIDPEDKDKDPDPDTDVAMPWVFLCEDLGSTDDFDFNDVVFSVSYVSGDATATVTPLAAGGTLETYIMYRSNQVGEEIHAMLGNSNTGTMINTSSKGAAGTPVTIDVSNLNMESNMGGFSVKVVNSNGTTTSVTAPGEGTAPQMICIGGASGITWPTERTSIKDAYSGFNAWGSNYQSNPDWYANPVSGKVIQ